MIENDAVGAEIVTASTPLDPWFSICVYAASRIALVIASKTSAKPLFRLLRRAARSALGLIRRRQLSSARLE
jgi:hypothetical protein